MYDSHRAIAPQRDGGGALRGLFDRCLSLRDRILASEKFKRRAGSFPLSRLIARRRARDLFDLCAGFVYSQVLLACVQLRLFDILLEKPQDLPMLSRRLGLTGEACSRLLEAAISLRLLELRGGGRYGLGPLGAALARNPSLSAMIEHHRHLYADLSDPVALLRGNPNATELSRYWPYADAPDPATLGEDAVAEYSALMAASQPMVADEVLDAYRLDAHRILLDVGGGDGAFLAEAAARFPQLRVMLFDLPAVAERARARLDQHGLAARSTAFGGDFFRDPLPKGADVISLVRVVLDHPDEKVLALLKSIRVALCQDGVLLLAEQLSESVAHNPMGSAYFSFYLMAMGRGRARTSGELASLLRSAGFRSVEVRKGRRVLQTGIIIAKT